MFSYTLVNARFKYYMIARSPERVIEIAVKGMLPKGPLGRAMYRKLKIIEKQLNSFSIFSEKNESGTFF